MNPGRPDIPQEFLQAARELRRLHPDPPSPYRLPLTVSTFGDLEMAAAFEALVRGPLTQGPRVAAFEAAFASAHGAPAAVFCNSGSSANLLTLTLLTRPGPGGAAAALGPGDEVIVPALTWSTAVWPVAQVGAVPVLADVSPATLDLTVDAVERALSKKTRAIVVVHTLGIPAPAAEIGRIAAARGLTVVEDCCEALDAAVGDRKVGTFGRVGTFSFYFSHHISTIEGGMILCADAADADTLRVLRSHGWSRQLPDETRAALARRHPDLDPRFLFVDAGFNLRGTEVQAALGLVQFPRRLEFLQRRRRIAAAWEAAVERHPRLFEPVRFAAGASPFAFPLLLRAPAAAPKARLTAFLEGRGIETRPLVAGNLARQPALGRIAHRVAGPLSGADRLHEQAIYVGLHPGLTDAQVVYFAETLDAFAREVAA